MIFFRRMVTPGDRPRGRRIGLEFGLDPRYSELIGDVEVRSDHPLVR